MPRSLIPLPTLCVALTLLLVLPPTVSATLVPGSVRGVALANDYRFKSDDTSLYFEQLTHRHHFVCTDCFLRINVTDSGLTVTTPAGSETLAPGWYEFREFRGSIAYTSLAPYSFSFQIDGVADIHGPL